MVTEREAEVYSDLAIPPGELLEEELAVLGMTQQELAIRTGRPVQAINEIVRGRKSITYDTALELEKVLGIPAHIWTNLEADYQLTKARLRDSLELEKQGDWLSEFPVKEMIKLGWLPSTRDKATLVRSLLQFLGVASFSAWRNTPEATAFRISPSARVSEEALACWLRQGELEAQNADLPPFDPETFRQALSSARSLTVEVPEVFEPRLRELCGQAGVALAIVPSLPKSAASGAARWITSERALIQLSLRYKWSDQFWFTFFHEGCHVLRHKVKDIHVDGIDGDSELEREANEFASNQLIPVAAWARFVSGSSFGRESVVSFARTTGVSPAVVVGRLQHERFIDFNALNDLRPRFTWRE